MPSVSGVLDPHFDLLLLAFIEGGLVVARKIPGDATQVLNILASALRAGVIELVCKSTVEAGTSA